MKQESTLKKLNKYLSSLKSVLIAFSGGVDSTFLLFSSLKVLGKKNVLAVIAKSETYPEHEFRFAQSFCEKNKIRYKVIKTKELKNKNFSSNPKNRCYYCKSELFSKLIEIAKEESIDHICDGSNHDDLSDFRPGTKAKKELGILSPLQEVGLKKAVIRKLSKKLKLPTWNKPSFACLSSRFPYGSKITDKKLRQIDKAEAYLRKLGFRQLRVRHHGDIARIELEQESMTKALKFKKQILKKLKTLGYTYVTLDLLGYRTGAMNEVL
ncbi:MAG: ATP-dependent sacrificial sulfur transferase LarE [Candidatus Saganbacteria bacterium]|nr:ATP-dependent sacrificial sulfur transferase LarE [Candidatus Saganbacteria bacterium]